MKHITKLVFIVWQLAISSLVCYSQFIKGSADGSGSLILPQQGGLMGFDIGKTELNAGFNNYGRVLKFQDSAYKDKHFWFATNLSVKNAGGFGALFSGGEIVPAANLNALIGLSFTNRKKFDSAIHKSACYKAINSVEDINDMRRKIWHRNFASQYKAFLPLLDDATSQTNKRTLFESYIDSLLNLLSSDSGRSLSVNEFRKKLEDYLVKVHRLKATDLFAVEIRNLVASCNQKATELTKEEYDKALLGRKDSCRYTADIPKFRRISPFIQVGIDARNFTWFRGLNTPSLADSFKDTLYRGGFFGIGINVQFGRHWFGGAFNWQSGDNFAQLTSKEYTLKTIDTAGNASLISEKKITAVSGNYGDVSYKVLNLDYVYVIPISDTSRILINPYLRAQLGSNNKDLFKNITTPGLAIHFLGNKGKFLGGLYVELPDINNNIEKAKPPAEQNIRSPYKKLSFGILARLSLGSLLSFDNRGPIIL